MKRLKFTLILSLILACLLLPALTAHASRWQWWPYGGNIWGYTMQPIGSHYIWLSPPTSNTRYFCVVGIFDCAPNFWFERGYVEQCRDGVFDRLGGTRYACRSDRGYWRTLYWQ